MTRVNGYYWVMLNNIWEVGCWLSESWFLCGIIYPLKDSDFNKINENEIKEPK